MRHSTIAAEPPSLPSDRTRVRLLDTPVTLVEDLRCEERRDHCGPVGFSADFQICLPYRGLFVWHVAGDEVVGDSNQVLFVSGKEAYHLSQPVAGGYAELIITPHPETLAEITGLPPARLRSHPLFRRRSRRADASLQRLRARVLHDAKDGVAEPITCEEAVIDLLRTAFDSAAREATPSAPTRRLISRAKAFLEANLSGRIRLPDVARAVGASPAYLTHAFRRVEGVPLHRYLIQLRLARALLELPHAGDLTTLALELGFSSHSHFTAAFRRSFRCTPSEYRASTRETQIR